MPFDPSVLQPGDTVRYYDPIGSAGNPEFLRTDIVTAIVKDEYPVILAHGGCLPGHLKLKKIPPEYSIGEKEAPANDGGICWRLIENYKFLYGGGGRVSGGVYKNSETMQEVGAHVREALMETAGCDAIPDTFNY